MVDQVRALADVAGASEALDYQCSMVRDSWTAYADAHVAVMWVSIAAVKPLGRSVDRARLARARRLLQELLEEKIPPFSAYTRGSADGIRVCLPPVLELWGADFLIVDGMHRVAACLEIHSLSSISALVVTSSQLPPPTVEPCAWSQVEVVTGAQSRSEKFPGYEPTLFRPTAEYFDLHSNSYASVEDVLQAASSGDAAGAGASRPDND